MFYNHILKVEKYNMKNKYVFILTITFLCSLLLSLASQGLKSKALKNIELDKKKNIMNAVGIDLEFYSIEDIDKYFIENIDTVIISLSGDINDKLSIVDLESTVNNQTGEIKYFSNSVEYLPLYKDKSADAIILPVSGKGLWSTLYGYFALDINNFSTVKGITFYDHGETPGLGAEISKKWFQNNFINKEIYNGIDLVSIIVTKAGMADKDNLYEVDGISGATITSNGVTELLKRDLNRYESYFLKNK